MLTAVAFVEVQDSVADRPRLIVVGEAVSVTVGGGMMVKVAVADAVPAAFVAVRV